MSDDLPDDPPGRGETVYRTVPANSQETTSALREEIAQLLYGVSNRIMTKQFWPGWTPRPLAEDPAASEAHYAYADAILAGPIATLTAERDRLRLLEPHPTHRLYAWLVENYSEDDPTKGEAFAPEARSLVSELARFMAAEGYSEP
jgi:hypothetical protein